MTTERAADPSGPAGIATPEPEPRDQHDALPVSVDEALDIVSRWTPGHRPFRVHQIGVALAEEVEKLWADAANDASYVADMKRSMAELCAAIGVERGTDPWSDFMVRVFERMDALAAIEAVVRDGLESLTRNRMQFTAHCRLLVERLGAVEVRPEEQEDDGA